MKSRGLMRLSGNDVGPPQHMDQPRQRLFSLWKVSHIFSFSCVILFGFLLDALEVTGDQETARSSVIVVGFWCDFMSRITVHGMRWMQPFQH